MIAYSLGLRIREAVKFKIEDIDSNRMLIQINRLSYRKDR